MRLTIPCKILVLLVVFLMVNSVAVTAREVNFNQLDALVNTCVKLIQSGDYRGAALMYHYPADYSDADLKTDLDGVESSLKVFVEEFGGFQNTEPLKESELYVNIFASSGTHEYWEEHPNVLKIELETDYENFGPGYLVIQLVDIVGMLEVKAIAFGLPVSGESVKKIKKVGDRMVTLMKNHQSANSAL